MVFSADNLKQHVSFGMKACHAWLWLLNDHYFLVPLAGCLQGEQYIAALQTSCEVCPTTQGEPSGPVCFATCPLHSAELRASPPSVSSPHSGVDTVQVPLWTTTALTFPLLT